MREAALLAVVAVVLAGCTGTAGAPEDLVAGPEPTGSSNAVQDLPGQPERPDAILLDACVAGEVTLLASRDDFEGYLPEGFGLEPDAATGLARIVATILDCDVASAEARILLPLVAVVPPDALRDDSADLHGIQLGILSDRPDLIAALHGWGFPESRHVGLKVERHLLPSAAALHLEAEPDFLLTVDAAGDAAHPAQHRRVFAMEVTEDGSFLTGALDLGLAPGPYLGGVATVSFVMSPRVGDLPDHRVGQGAVGLLERDATLRRVAL